MKRKLIRHGVDQEAFQRAFGTLSVEQAARLLTGTRKATRAQCRILHAATGYLSPDHQQFNPEPCGHIRFRVSHVPAGGTFKSQHILEPATPECRDRVVEIRRTLWLHQCRKGSKTSQLTRA